MIPPGTHERPCGAEKEPLPPVAVRRRAAALAVAEQFAREHPFRDFVAAKIKQLRLEADALERLLAESPAVAPDRASPPPPEGAGSGELAPSGPRGSRTERGA